MKKYILMLMVGASLTTASYAQDDRVIDGDRRCYNHEFQQGEIVRLNITTFTDLRIEMPFPIYTAKLGGGSLWQATFTQGVKHIWIKSKSLEPEGRATSLTVLDNNLDAYDFVITRVEEPGYTCAVISGSQDLNFLSDLDNFQTPEQREIAALRQQLGRAGQQYQQSIEQVKEHAENVISASHSSIYAGYSWSADNRSESSATIASAITSVHDDGILTFINMSGEEGGVYSIQGDFGGETQLVQADYNPLLSMYTITGVYSSLTITGEEGSATITRGMGR